MKILTDPRKYKRYLSNFDGVLALDLDYIKDYNCEQILKILDNGLITIDELNEGKFYGKFVEEIVNIEDTTKAITIMSAFQERGLEVIPDNEIVDIIENGINENIEFMVLDDIEDVFAFIDACKYGDLKQIDLMLDYGYNIHNGREAALFAAIDAQNVSSVRYLLKKGANANAMRIIDVSYENDTAIYTTPLSCTVAQFNKGGNPDTAKEIIDILLEHGSSYDLIKENPDSNVKCKVSVPKEIEQYILKKQNSFIEIGI